jgi:4-hydroxy-2-oxoheptanedioate aldolase
MVRAAYAADITPLVRVSRNDEAQILKALDFRAKGIIVPQIGSKAEVGQLVGATHYRPVGHRSCTPGHSATQYGFGPWAGYTARANEDVLAIPLIEERRAIGHLDEIIAVEGVDWVHFGPFDMAVSMGLSDYAFDPTIQEYRTRVITACRRRGLPVMDLAWDVDSAIDFMRQGADVIALGTDLSFLNLTVKSVAGRL